MDAGDWTPEEWAALTREDAAPTVRYEPWGDPLKKTHPEALQDADYIARKLLDLSSTGAGPLGWMLNAAVPRPAPGSEAMQTVDTGLDYVGTFLGPLMGLLMGKQYARQKSGRPAPSWKEQSPYTKANSPREQLENWPVTEPWKDKPPLGESAWTSRNPPPIGGPTGRGMTKEETLAAIEKDKFQGMLKQIRDLEARDAAQPALRLPPGRSPQPGTQIDDDRLDWMIGQMWKQGGADPSGPFKPPPLPGG